MKRVTVCQSNYIPWKGYFDLINDVDVFVFYDDVQFTKNDWRNRNRIKTDRGLIWLSIPVGADLKRRICEVEIPDSRWQVKHWKTIRQYYSRAPFFPRYEGLLSEVYLGREWRNLSELNQYLVTRIARECLGIRTELAQSSAFGLEGRRQERLLNLLRGIGADVYVSGPSAKAYLEPRRFRELGIELVWKDYSGYPEYPQLWPPFEHGVTILDLLFQVGPEAPYYIWGWRAHGSTPAGST